MIAGINTGNRPDLRDAEHEHDGGEQSGMRNTGDEKAESDERGLHQRRHDDTERHALHRLPGEDHRRIAAISRESARERAHAAGSSFALCVENGRDDHRDQKVPEQAAHATGDRQEPGGHGFDVGTNRFGELLRSASGQLLPLRRQALATKRYLREPIRRWAQAVLEIGTDDLDAIDRRVEHRTHRRPERHDENQQHDDAS